MADPEQLPIFDSFDRALLKEAQRLREANRRLNALLQAERREKIELRNRGSLDELTGLPNRATLNGALKKAHRRAARTEVGFGVILVDIDHFKMVNDTFGHVGGDTILKGVAAALNAGHRPFEVGRWGGEEFMIVLPDCKSLKDAALVAERVRRGVEATTHQVKADGICSMVATVSMGVAFYDPNEASSRSQTPLSVVNQADKALYRAKGQGAFKNEVPRNRVGVSLQDGDLWILPRLPALPKRTPVPSLKQALGPSPVQLPLLDLGA